MIIKFKKIVSILITSNFWKKPKVYKNLMIDEAGADDLFNSGIIKQHETYIVNLNNFAWLNIYVFIHAMVKRPKLLLENKFSFIMTSYIDYVKPKYVITWMDYITSFYRLKTYVKDPIYISIQTGRRSIEPGQFFDELQTNRYKGLSCDYIFCFGHAHAQEYRKYIECSAVQSGSVRSNIVPIKNPQKAIEEILFVSQYRSKANNDPFITYDTMPISWDTFYKTEKILFPLLVNYCKRKSIKLNIISAMAGAEQEEENYFDDITEGFEYNFINHKDGTSGYEAVDNFKYIVGVHSTLLYEALARKSRVVFFDCRGGHCGIPFDTFGWPMKSNVKGDFWTNEINTSEFDRLMTFLIHETDEKWSESRDKIKHSLMNFDNNNTLLREVLS